jgi:hypothetical protein
VTQVGKKGLSRALKTRHGKLKDLPRVPRKRTANYFGLCMFLLLCAIYKMHGKEALCCAPEEKCMTKRLFVVRLKENTW